MGSSIAVAVVIAAVAAWSASAVGPERIRRRAEAEARSGDWPAALDDWRRVNRSPAADARSFLGEARAALEQGMAAQAERALRGATRVGPADPEPWRLWLEVLRVEDRPSDAIRVGWEAYEAVPRSARRGVLRSLTLALLFDTPDELARRTLKGWIAADPDDSQALTALYRRISPMPMLGDPEVEYRIARLRRLLDRRPEDVVVREGLIQTLADAGEADEGRRLLDEWPEPSRDARYKRLRGRWDLDYDHRPAEAVAALREALAELPHDWRTHYRLARALRVVGLVEQARSEAETVSRLRELLDPVTLDRRLTADLDHIDDPKSRLDLADLCARVGLTRLAEAWRLDAAEPDRSQTPGNILGVAPEGPAPSRPSR